MNFHFPSDSPAAKARLAKQLAAEKQAAQPKAATTRRLDSFMDYLRKIGHPSVSPVARAPKHRRPPHEEGIQVTGFNLAEKTADANPCKIADGQLIHYMTLYDGWSIAYKYAGFSDGKHYIYYHGKRLPYGESAPVLAHPDTKEGGKLSNWIEWAGGECPVAAGTAIQYKMRQPLDYDSVSHDPKELRWDHVGSPGDIIAYRVLP